ncbi:hypothetical protein pb186bvf_000170 [Paramecium bursaria]
MISQQNDPKLPIKKAHFINSSIKTNIKLDYKFIKELGSGSFGVVFLAEDKKTCQLIIVSLVQRHAIKAIAKDRVVNKGDFQNELKILRKIDHPNILKLYKVYETDKTIYLVTELCEGGELFYFITKTKFLTEAQAAMIMRQMFSAVAYLHQNKIVHRDLKPENFLLRVADDPSSIKLIDFGLARPFKENELMTQANGSMYYFAPEMIEGLYNYEVDNWALGVILYIMLSGSPPFNGKSPRDIIESIKKGIYSLGRQGINTASDYAKDLISKLLVTQPKKRYTASQAYQHPWVQLQVKLEIQNLQISQETINGIARMLNARQMKKTILLYLATFIQEEEITNLKQLFVSLDSDGNGMLSLEEMIGGLSKFRELTQQNIDTEYLRKLFVAMDIDKSGFVDYSEFIAAFMNCPQFQSERFLKEQFRKIDQDNSGKISKDELMNIFHTDTISIKDIDIVQLIEQADLDKDGEIDFSEQIS